jgi:hypothetical protein
MPAGIYPNFGRPGIGTAQLAQRRNVGRNGAFAFYPAGGVIEGTKARDPGNSAYSTLALRPGLLMGKITSGGYWANSILGLTDGALASAGTTVTLSAAAAAELVRRVGASGTFKLTGPPTAAGIVRTLTITYSAVDTGTGVVTITAPGVNEVQTIAFGAAATAGTFKIGFTLASGAVVWTDTIAWSATDATFLSNMNAAIDNVLGAGLVVATAIPATDTDLGFVLTFSGAGYTALPQSLVAIDAAALTSVTTVTVTRTTTGVDGRFVTISLAQPSDGSETIRSMIPDGYGLVIPDDSADIDFPMIPIAGTVDVGATGFGVIDWPSDASLKSYIRAALEIAGGGEWVFSDMF